MNREKIITAIRAHIQSHQGQPLGAYIDVEVPWGRTFQITVRVQRMTGVCINLNANWDDMHPDGEMTTIDCETLDQLFAEQEVSKRVTEPLLAGVHA
jgi:hypothetical protein